MNKNKLTHLDDDGNPSMVDINKKEMTERVAIAFGKITMQTETLQKILDIKIKKGDVLNIAKIAGIMAAKRTDQLIPLCHTIPLSYVNVDLKPEIEESCIRNEKFVSDKSVIPFVIITGCDLLRGVNLLCRTICSGG